MPDPTSSRRLTLESELSSAEGVSDVLLAFARRQAGVVSRAQLLGAGIPSGTIDSRIRARRLLTIYRGVYGVGRGVLNHRGRRWAAVLATGEGAALARRTAAEMWGFGQPSRIIETVRSFNRRKGSRPVELNTDTRGHRLVVHRTRHLPEGDVGQLEGLPVTTPARTLVDLASEFEDLPLNACLAEASRLGLLDFSALEEVCGRSRRWRGSRRLRRCLAGMVSGLASTRSELESRFLKLCQDRGIPVPETNVPVAGLEVDCLWRDANLVVELDGYAFHRGPVAFERDRERDVSLVNEGFKVLRFSYAAVTGRPDYVAEAIGRNLTQP